MIQTVDISLDKIKTQDNSRFDINDEDLSVLMNSINDVGLLQPIAVQTIEESDRYSVVFGNRRFLAFKKLKKTSIPAVVYGFELDKHTIRKMHLIENIIRRNLSVEEEGREYMSQMKDGMTAKEIAAWLNIALVRVNQAISVASVTPEEFRKDVVRSGSGVKIKSGKIPAVLNTSIISASKSYSLSSQQRKELYLVAKKSPTWAGRNMKGIAAAIASGLKPDPQTVDTMVSFHCVLIVSQKEVKRLENFYIKNKLYRNLASVARAILRGNIEEKIKCLNRS